jgi:hypothetical protein
MEKNGSATSINYKLTTSGYIIHTLSQVALVGQTRQDMRILKIVVIVGSENIGRDDGSEVASVLLIVCLVLDINHTLSVSITEVGLVRRTVVDHGFVNGVASLVREDAGGKT